MIKVWTDNAWVDYLYWQEQDRKTLRTINRLLKDIEREPFSGLGKPEPLKHNWSGYWSRRIDVKNRIIYRIEQGKLEIAQCKAHYED
ncbi:Txe/YoeB family addiction module toxin [Clostridia bacterium]|nr:Txe/YoeB family addiction module toxin [Clostridia bacterium]GHU57504.1 Txe/YoeB family addiction module toxin [Clostridia bacterium]